MPPAASGVQMRFTLALKTETLAADAPFVRPRLVVSPYLVAGGLGFLVLSLTGTMLIDVELEGLYHFIFTYLTVPVLALTYGIAWLGMRAWLKSASRMKACFAPGLVALTILLTCSGVVNYANALLARGASVCFSGPITRLRHSSGRSSRGYYLTLRDTATGQARKFRITRPEYLKLRLGDTYSHIMKQGGLGYAFRWM
ncbi:MAG TPA: hypothetical protein VHI52_06435 [Verrucomicrobiae bacterium]|nr:hypothetical protein [Verrucomicrobiae bacterium]